MFGKDAGIPTGVMVLVMLGNLLLAAGGIGLLASFVVWLTKFDAPVEPGTLALWSAVALVIGLVAGIGGMKKFMN